MVIIIMFVLEPGKHKRLLTRKILFLLPSQIDESDLRCLKSDSLINDSVLQFLIMESTYSENVHVFSTLFYSRLVGGKNDEEGFSLVKRWTKNVDIFSKSVLLIPIYK